MSYGQLTTEDLDNQWSEIQEWIFRVITEPNRSAYIRMLVELKDDWSPSPGITWLGFKRAPAAKGNHHNRS